MAKVKLPIYQRTQLIGGDFGTGDPYYDSVILLLPFDDTSVSETQDLSPVGRQPTGATGTAAISRALSYFPSGPHGPTGSLLLDGNSDELTYAASTEWHINTAYTIETHFRLSEVNRLQTLFCTRTPGAAIPGWFIGVQSGNLIGLTAWDGSTAVVNVASDTTVSISTWYHLAVCRDSGGNWTMYLDGALVASTTETAVSGDSNEALHIGRDNTNSSRYFNGRMDNIRITRGVCRYTENFTPPKAPYPNYKKRAPATSIAPSVPAVDPLFSNVILLAPFSSDLNDVSANANTGSAVGTAEINSNQTLFGYNTLDITIANGDAVDFPDITDYNVAGDEWTFEFHVNFESVVQRSGVIAQTNGTGNRAWFLGYDPTSLLSTNPVWYYYYTTNGSSYIGQLGSYEHSPTLGTWYHITFMRDVNTMRFFIDGTEITPTAAATIGTIFNATGNFRIGGLQEGSNTVDAHIANVRWTNVKRYTTDFTPPTAPYPT